MTNRTRHALIFDMDGTLVESEHLHQESWIGPLAARGVLIDDAIYAEHFAGKPGMHIIRDFVQLENSEAESLYHDVNTAYWELAERQVVPMAGLLTFLTAVPAVPKAVCTSAQRASAIRMLDLLSISEHFGTVITANDVMNGKPDPEPFLTAAERLRVLPEACVAFEDSGFGLTAARSAGMFTVGIGAGETRFQHLADAWIRDFDDPRLAEALELAGMAGL